MRHDSLRRTFALLGFAFAANAPAAPLDLVPDAIVGKNSFTEVITSVSATQLAVPGGIAEDPATGELWVSDSANRVLRFPSAAAYTAGQPANLVLGQPDFTSSQPNRGGAVAANTLKFPRGVAVNQLGYVYVADSGNNRVLVFKPPFTNGMNASFVLGQADFTQGGPGATTSGLSFPTGLALDNAGHLFVADTSNARVLRFAAPHATGAAAASEFKSEPLSGNADRFALDQPTSVAVDAAGGLWIADFTRNWVVRHPNATQQSGLPTTVVCQPNFTDTTSGGTLSKCSGPTGVAIGAEGSIYVADSIGRVLRFPPNPAIGAAASEAITGSFLFCDQVVPSTAPCGVRAVMVDRRGNLHLGDNHARVMRYDLPRARNAPVVTSLSPNTVPVGSAFQLTVNGDAFDAGATVLWDGQPRATQFISSKRLVAQIPAGDPAGVFGYAVAVVNPSPGGGASAPVTFTPYVRGKLDGLADRFLLAPGFDDLDPTRTGEERYGSINGNSVPNHELATLAIQPGTGRLFLSDPINSRILSWPSATAFRNLDPADLILGQVDEFAGLCNRGQSVPPTASTLCVAGKLAFDAAGALYVADTFNHRVLKYVPPFTTGMAASTVFGQGGSFTTATPNQGADPAGRLFLPTAIAVNGGALWVHDAGNRHIRRYSNPDQVQLADLDIGTTTQPCPTGKFCLSSTVTGSMAFDASGRLYLISERTVRRFSPPFQAEQLPDATITAGGSTGPALGFGLQVAFDPSGGLLVAEIQNARVLRYEPPFTDASVASQVLGQPDFETTGGTPSRSRTGSTISVVSDAQGNVYTFDGARLLAFDTPFAPAVAGADYDNDGIPNGLETSEGRDPWTKDNDVFTNPRLFAMQQYRDFLSREGDATGVSFWSGAVGNGSIGRSAMIESFFNSGEFQGTISPVARLYFAYFQRIPDYSGLNFWIGYYKAGNTLASVSQNFALSPEFTSRYGALNNSQFVDLVYQNVLGRAPDAGGKAFWQGQLDSGAQTRGQVMVGFSESDEYKLASFNKVYVTMMYIGMLRRSPDQGGFDFWVNYKNQGNSGLALIDGFLVSQEYRSRFLP